ncbi:MAG: hypothetical protein ACFFAV_16755 [Candidatus Hermodarchaeota archaeon]
MDAATKERQDETRLWELLFVENCYPKKPGKGNMHLCVNVERAHVEFQPSK